MNELVRNLEEIKREKEILTEDLGTAKHSADVQNDQIGRLESELGKLKDEVGESLDYHEEVV